MIKRRLVSDLLANLIKINSVNPSLDSQSEGEKTIAYFIGEYLENLGLQVEYQNVSGNRKNVIGILKGFGDGKTLMLNGHIDTVSDDGMEYPYEPRIENGKIFGRGAYDMKGGVVSSILAIKSVLDKGIKLSGDVILTLVVDEEYASLGTETVLAKYTADAAIICEPTNSEIVIAHKGFVWANIEIFGKAAHGSKPDEGIDAILKAGKVLMELDNLQTSKFQNSRHPLLGSPSIHASLIEGGIGLSTYPDYCKISLERRTLPHETVESVELELKTILQNLRSQDQDFDAELDIFFSRSGLEVSERQQIVQLVGKAREKILGKPFTVAGETYWMDSALLYEAGIPTVVIGPDGEGAHAAIEYVEIESVAKIGEILVEVIKEFCGTT